MLPLEQMLRDVGVHRIAGVDEAGRGACCGPITIAACILPPDSIPGLRDSKQLTAKRRAALFPIIQQQAVAWSIVHIEAQEIDQFGIQHANISGMRRAAAHIQPAYVLSDAMRIPGLNCPHLPVIGGDAAVDCIAAASILAKHARDLRMIELDTQYPGYGLASHKGYGTKSHMESVRLHGGTPEHRYSYANVAQAHEHWRMNEC